MATDFDPYRILGTDKHAFSDDLYAAYQRSLTEAAGDEARIREIEAAYSILGNMEQRREYDRRVAEREAMGVATLSPAAIKAAAPKSTFSSSEGVASVPWTLGDVAKALVLPLILIAINIIAALTADFDADDLTETDYIVNFGFGFLLEAALLALAWHFGLRKHKLTWRAFGFHWPKGLQWWFPLAITAAAMGTIYIYVLVLLAFGVEPEGNIPENVYDYVIPVIMLGLLSALVAPIVEEVFFRAFLFQGFAKRWGVYAGIAISALIFGLAHIADLDSLIVAPPIAVIGAIFAWAYARTGSIYPSMIAHIIFNSVAFFVGFTQ